MYTQYDTSYVSRFGVGDFTKFSYIIYPNYHDPSMKIRLCQNINWPVPTKPDELLWAFKTRPFVVHKRI